MNTRTEVVCTLGLCIATLCMAQTQMPPLLELGKPIAKEIRTGEIHYYKVQGRTGDFLRGTVRQEGIAVNVRALFRDGAKVRLFDGPPAGPKNFRFVAETPGDYQLEIRGAGAGASGTR